MEFIHSTVCTYFHGVRISPQNNRHTLLSAAYVYPMAKLERSYNLHNTTHDLCCLWKFLNMSTRQWWRLQLLLLGVQASPYQLVCTSGLPHSESVSAQNSPRATRGLSRNAGTPRELCRCQYRVPRPSALRGRAGLPTGRPRSTTRNANSMSTQIMQIVSILRTFRAWRSGVARTKGRCSRGNIKSSPWRKLPQKYTSSTHGIRTDGERRKKRKWKMPSQ